MLLILYSISGVNSRNGGKMVRKKMVEKWILNGFHFDKGSINQDRGKRERERERDLSTSK